MSDIIPPNTTAVQGKRVGTLEIVTSLADEDTIVVSKLLTGGGKKTVQASVATLATKLSGSGSGNNDTNAIIPAIKPSTVNIIDVVSNVVTDTELVTRSDKLLKLYRSSTGNISLSDIPAGATHAIIRFDFTGWNTTFTSRSYHHFLVAAGNANPLTVTTELGDSSRLLKNNRHRLVASFLPDAPAPTSVTVTVPLNVLLTNQIRWQWLTSSGINDITDLAGFTVINNPTSNAYNGLTDLDQWEAAIGIPCMKLIDSDPVTTNNIISFIGPQYTVEAYITQ